MPIDWWDDDDVADIRFDRRAQLFDVYLVILAALAFMFVVLLYKPAPDPATDCVELPAATATVRR